MVNCRSSTSTRNVRGNVIMVKDLLGESRPTDGHTIVLERGMERVEVVEE